MWSSIAARQIIGRFPPLRTAEAGSRGRSNACVGRSELIGHAEGLRGRAAQGSGCNPPFRPLALDPCRAVGPWRLGVTTHPPPPCSPAFSEVNHSLGTKPGARHARPQPPDLKSQGPAVSERHLSAAPAQVVISFRWPRHPSALFSHPFSAFFSATADRPGGPCLPVATLPPTVFCWSCQAA